MSLLPVIYTVMATIVRTQTELEQALLPLRLQGKKVGFVPTMGALHEGHLSLVKQAVAENEAVVVSIYVNPTQFNNASDLELYPRTLEADVALLNAFENLFVFHPDFATVYPENDGFIPFDLGILNQVMEGAFRPGHFEGVAHVVHNLFRLVNPTRAYFGRKDFQQLAVIRKMTQHFQFPIEIIACETMRQEDGLAMSSRNMRLSESEKKDALIIWETLQMVQQNKENQNPQELSLAAKAFFSTGKLELEYLEIVGETSLETVTDWSQPTVCCIAAYCGAVRLIDNLLL